MAIWLLVWLKLSNQENLWWPFLPTRFVDFKSIAFCESFCILENQTKNKSLKFQASPSFSASRNLDYASSISDWKRRDIQYCRLESYDLTYAHYCKFPSWELQVMPSLGANDTIIPAHLPHTTHSNFHSTYFQSYTLLNVLFVQLTNILPCFQPTLSNFPFPIITTNANNLVSHPPFTNNKLNSNFVVAHLIMMLILLQLIPFVLVYYIEECSPLVLFSWWRNKISWNAIQSKVC